MHQFLSRSIFSETERAIILSRMARVGFETYVRAKGSTETFEDLPLFERELWLQVMRAATRAMFGTGEIVSQ